MYSLGGVYIEFLIGSHIEDAIPLVYVVHLRVGTPLFRRMHVVFYLPIDVVVICVRLPAIGIRQQVDTDLLADGTPAETLLTAKVNQNIETSLQSPKVGNILSDGIRAVEVNA